MKSRERVIWIGVTALLLAFVGAFAVAPALTAESKAAESRRYLDMFSEVFKSVQQNYFETLDPKMLYEGAMKGLFASLNDPPSYYLTRDELRDLTDITQGEFGGVGLIISKPPEITDDASLKPLLLDEAPAPPYVEVVSSLRGSPAYRAGISAGDRITMIGNESTEGMSIDEVVDKLRGAPGSEVSITVLRGADITKTVQLERAVIEVPDVKYAMIPGGIAYLRISQYTAFTADKVREALDFFKANGYSSMIIDERGNPGGRLSAVVEVADYFLQSGTIVSTRSRIESENQVYAARGDAVVPASFPIIVLIDKGSASAAEILAGALHDNHRALLMGETSFGKGSVQQVFFLPDGEGAFKLTTAKYYTPDGINIDKIGITPDKIVNVPALTAAEEDSLKKLVEANVIESFVRDNAAPSAKVVGDFIAKLHAQGIVLGDSMLTRMVREAQNRMVEDPPVYDLDYDTVLKEAVRLISSGEYEVAGQ